MPRAVVGDHREQQVRGMLCVMIDAVCHSLATANVIWENLQTNPVTGFELVGRCEGRAGLGVRKLATEAGFRPAVSDDDILVSRFLE